MKLKTLLKTVNAVKMTITVQTDGKYFDYDIDQLSNEPVFKTVGYMRCNSRIYIPQYVLDRNVTFVDVHDDTLYIRIYERGD